MRNKFIIFFFLITRLLLCQSNLVINSSFESHSSCPNSTAQWNLCTNWNNCSGGGTPDFYHTCGTINGNPNQNPVPPNCAMGNCNPHSGGGMMGIINYDTPFPNYREYISNQMACPMIAGNVYTISFWVNTGTNPNYNFYINNLGVYLSASQPIQSGFNPISVIPQFEITSVINNTVWVQYTFTINPSSNFNYITLGNFRTDGNTTIVNFSSAHWAYANWFIDDVNVVGYGGEPISADVSGTSTDCDVSNGSATVTSQNGSYTYTWLPGNQSTPVISGLSAGTYTVLIRGGCVTDTKTITINKKEFTDLSATSSSSLICLGTDDDRVIFSASGAVSYSWSPGNINAASFFVSPSSSIIYTVNATNSFGCLGSKTVQVTVSNTPTINIIASSPSICLGNNAVLFANGALSYTWSMPSITGNSISVSPQTNANYTVLGSNGYCYNTNTVNITVNPNPTLQIQCNPSSFCGPSGNSATLSVIGAINYTWEPNGNLTNSLVIMPALNETYTITGVNEFGCITTNSVNYFVTPVLRVDTNQTPLCSGKTALLIASGALNYTWQPGNLTGNNIYIKLDVSTTFTVTGLNGNCNDTKTLNIEVYPTPEIAIPEVFTPNNDGKNDQFVIAGLANTKVNLTVFNRWGNKVYENANYDNSWAGYANCSSVMFGNNKLPQSTYYYIAELDNCDHQIVRGFIVLQY